MLYTEKEKNEIERVRKVFEKHIQQMTAYDLVWSDKVGYVWLAISIDPVYIDTGNWIESAAAATPSVLSGINRIQRWSQSKPPYLAFIYFFASIYSIQSRGQGCHQE